MENAKRALVDEDILHIDLDKVELRNKEWQVVDVQSVEFREFMTNLENEES